MNKPEFISCRELSEFLMDYVDGALPPDRQREFDRHLAVCPSCVVYLDSYKATIRLGKDAFAATDEPATRVAPEGLVRAVREARKSGRVSPPA
ncbi:MAG: anti-sigma factor family protein [Phycisphaerales bacterium]